MAGVFSIHEIEKNIDCDIYFYQSGVYELMLSEFLSDDVLLSILISYGHYTIRDGDFELIDNYNGHKMLFTCHSDYIIAKKIYPAMLNKKFVKSNFKIWDKPSYTKMKIMPLNQERLKHKQEEKEENPLPYGIFKSEWGFGLNLQSNYKYTLEYKKIILSKGTWNRVGNELRLQDSVLNHSFYIMIGKNVLLSKFLPEENTVSNFSNLLPMPKQ